VHQFRLMAQRVKPNPAPAKRRKGGGGGRWRPYTVTPKRAPGLATVKHAERQQTELPPAQKCAASPWAVDCGWPDDMQRQLFACRTVEDHRAWAERWADHLSGEAARRKIAAMTPVRSAPCGLCVRSAGLRPDCG
jgi:hypothetical protein